MNNNIEIELEANKSLESLVYTIRETSILLKCSDKSVRRFIILGKLKRLKGFRHIRIPKSSIEEFLRKQSE